ncbi:hypothetical protein F5Y18DRAFT_167059 [Xylariaceae sp. FL1019]|nr:hypothetical protein F5Y18DRAFT_167059 [Xylariaceae sp. FL1019]
MKLSLAILAGLALAGNAVAAPLVERATMAADIIAAIAPKSKSCAGRGDECMTNVQIAGPFVAAMNQYDLKYPAQIAAVLALTAFESDEYGYNRNQFPGRPGQGTSNMQMIDYNVKYAESIPALKDKVAAIGDPSTDDKKNQVLDLVTDVNYNFGSGPWFLSTQCSKDVVEGLKVATDAAFAAYMGCVGVEATADRTAYWTAAKTAFGL